MQASNNYTRLRALVRITRRWFLILSPPPNTPTSPQQPPPPKKKKKNSKGGIKHVAPTVIYVAIFVVPMVHTIRDSQINVSILQSRINS